MRYITVHDKANSSLYIVLYNDVRNRLLYIKLYIIIKIVKGVGA